MSHTAILAAIRSRRSVYPTSFSEREIERAAVETLLEAARYAPNHKHTEPWRFRVFLSETSRADLAEFWASHYKATTPPAQFSEAKYERFRTNPRLAGCAVAVSVQYSNRLPEVEEVCATACAVQNLLLAAGALGIGGYWSTGGPTFAAENATYLGLANNEHCLGYIFLGYIAEGFTPLDVPRKAIEEVTMWR